MEKFAVDLDRVLDEFELNEDLESVGYQKHMNSGSDFRLKEEVYKAENDFGVPYVKSSSSSAAAVNSFEPSTLDLSEADFAPSISSTLVRPLPLITELPQQPELTAVNHNTYVESEKGETRSVSSVVEPKSVTTNSYAEEVNLLLDDYVSEKQNDYTTKANQVQEFSVADSIKPLHYDETINKDYLITFGRKRDPHPVARVSSTNVNNQTVIPFDIGVRNEADGSTQTSVEEILQISNATVNGPSSETSELEDTFTTPDDGSSMTVMATCQLEPASFSQEIEVTEDDIQRYLESDVSSEDAKLGFEDFYTPVTDTVLRESDLLGLDSVEHVAADDVIQQIDNSQRVQPPVDLSELTEPSGSQEKPVEQSIYDVDQCHSESIAENDTLEQRITRPTSLSLPSKIQEPTAMPPAPDSNDLDSAMEDGEPNAFTSLTATAGSPDAGLGLSPDEDEVEESSEPLSAASDVPLTEEEKQIGKVAPLWIPDSEALNCMQCGVKFTVIRRRHHCRACGRVLCGNCSGLKAKMTYLDNKEARVCQMCLDVISKDGPKSKGEPKQVMFSDGIRPGGDLTELDGPDQRQPYRRQGRLQRRVDRQSASNDAVGDDSLVQSQEYSLSDNLDPEQLFAALKDECTEPLVFVVSRNLKVLVKIIEMTCCVKKTCWCIVSQGMSAVGQDEVVVLIELLPDEQALPVDVFHHLNDLYEDASKGSPVSHMGHTVSIRPLFGSKDHVGFLYFRPTFQCLKKLPLPQPPFLFAVLLQKWEIPWAKVFPLRLLLRLGAEYRYYPCPLYGVRFRTPVFFEIGHTIVNLLADFRNYQYSLPAVPGLVIHMKDGETTINFPRNRYDEVVKALNTGIDHVLALAATFSTEADSHLVCIQNDQGNYQPQAISIDDKPRIVTGASFVVFNGALKSSSGLTAKSSIVEDGVMVHIPAESMTALRQTLKDMKDYVVACGPIGAEKPDEVVRIQWVDDDKSINIGVRSSIDGKPLDGVTSIRIHRGMDYVGDGFLIRWTEVYLIKNDTAFTSRSCDPTDVSKVSDTLAQACCLALAPHLSSLYSNGLTKIGLRITLNTESVGYEVGANEKVLASRYMNDLDSELVPAIHSAASFHQEGSLVLELIFHVLQQ